MLKRAGNEAHESSETELRGLRMHSKKSEMCGKSLKDRAKGKYNVK